ncbi:MAG: hypothetical protein EPO11_01665 [Gammaproteobacteria bacterium]|nr:MAG: hypothetical protein EPO11_01665 [Gammaproteobacteria bacterium]
MYYDLIIVGGGLVGAGFAAALRDTSLRIALVEAKLPSQNDPRLFALNYGSCQFLHHLGLWPALASYAAPIHQVHVSHQGRFGAVRLRREDIHLPTLGHVIPARFIEAALNELLTTLPNVTLYRPAKLISLHQKEGCATLLLETEAGEKSIQSAIVIGADGTDSTVRSQLNMATHVVDYQQSAIVTRTKLKRSSSHIAYERFVDNGVIAMLPLTNDECATIWTADNAVISHLMSLSDEAFRQALQQAFGYRLGRLQSIQQRHHFPLRMVRAEKAMEQCVLLLGNALHTLPPVAAQGFNLALYEVAALVESIKEKGNLQQALLQTQKQQAKSIDLSHRLSQLFSRPSLLTSLMLPLGMLGLDLITPIKVKCLKDLMGRAGRVPPLLLSAGE